MNTKNACHNWRILESWRQLNFTANSAITMQTHFHSCLVPQMRLQALTKMNSNKSSSDPCPEPGKSIFLNVEEFQMRLPSEASLSFSIKNTIKTCWCQHQRCTLWRRHAAQSNYLFEQRNSSNTGSFGKPDVTQTKQRTDHLIPWSNWWSQRRAHSAKIQIGDGPGTSCHCCMQISKQGKREVLSQSAVWFRINPLNHHSKQPTQKHHNLWTWKSIDHEHMQGSFQVCQMLFVGRHSLARILTLLQMQQHEMSHCGHFHRLQRHHRTWIHERCCNQDGFQKLCCLMAGWINQLQWSKLLWGFNPHLKDHHTGATCNEHFCCPSEKRNLHRLRWKMP